MGITWDRLNFTKRRIYHPIEYVEVDRIDVGKTERRYVFLNIYKLLLSNSLIQHFVGFLFNVCIGVPFSLTVQNVGHNYTFNFIDLFWIVEYRSYFCLKKKEFQEYNLCAMLTLYRTVYLKLFWVTFLLRNIAHESQWLQWFFSPATHLELVHVIV